MGQGDGGNLEILGTNADFLPTEIMEGVCRNCLKRNDFPILEEVEQFDEAFVSWDLLLHISCAMNLGQPALALLCNADDGHAQRIPGVFQATY